MEFEQKKNKKSQSNCAKKKTRMRASREEGKRENSQKMNEFMSVD